MASKLKLLNANGNTLTIENGDTSNSDMNVRYFKTVSDLTNATGINGDTAVLTDVDRGGTFVYDSTAIDNKGTVFGKWKRIYSGSVNVKWFGANGDGIASEVLAIQNAATTKYILIPFGVYDLPTSPIISNDTVILIQNGTTFTGAGMLGGRHFYFGKSDTWLSDISSGIYSYLELNTTASLFPPKEGGIGIISSARSSGGAGAVGEAHIGIAGIAYNDHIGGDAGAWALYGTALRAAGATGATHAIELDIANTSTTVSLFPNAMFSAGQTHGIWLGSGGESTATLGLCTTASVAIGIISNDLAGVANFDKGIVFHNKSIAGTNGETGEGIAIAFAKGHKQTWFNNTNQVVGNIICTTSTITKALRLDLGEYGLLVADSTTGTTNFQVENTPSSANYITVKSGVSTAPAQIIANGSDANINIKLTPKGTGVIMLGYGTTVATTPSSFSATNRFAIKDAAGTTWYIPVSSTQW